MDLSKLSDNDLLALKSGDLTKVSDAGLMALKGTTAREKPGVMETLKSQQFKDELMTSLPGGLARGLKDVVDTGALGLSKLFGQSEQIAEQNKAGRADFERAQNAVGAGASDVARFGGNMLATTPIGGALAGMASKIPGVATKAAPFIEALRTSGFSSGVSGLRGLPARMAGGAVAGGISAGLVNPEDAGMGAAIGGALPFGGEVLKGAATLARHGIGASTGVGDEALKQAFSAGQKGGQTAQDFTSAMRGTGQQLDVLAMAKQNLQSMAQQKMADYRSGMVNIKNDRTVLGFGGVDQKIKDAANMVAYKGQVKNPQAAKAVQEAADAVSEWKALNPSDFHTPEGMDALKQRIGAIQESIPFEQKQAREAVGGIYNAIKDEIKKQAPTYSKVMKDYSEATSTIKEIERALSLGEKASADTGMRKLQSLMRNNVNTNYGQRTALAEQLVKSGGQDFMPILAGQSLNEFMPRGLSRVGVGTGGGLLTVSGAYGPAAALAAISSPRLMGEAMYGAGKLSNTALADAIQRGAYKGAPLIPAQSDQR